MTYAELKREYLTPANVAIYSKQTDKLVWVSDLTGLSVDDAMLERLDLAFWNHMEGDTDA